MGVESIVIPLALFAAIVALVWLLTAMVTQMSMARTLRDAARTSPENLGLIAERLVAPRGGSAAEIAGFVGVGTGAALGIAALIGDAAMRTPILQGALLPLFIGGAMLLQGWLMRRRGANTPAPAAIADARSDA